VINPALALQDAMRTALLADATLVSLLQGHHVYDEMPRGATSPTVGFGDIETRDWSTADAKAHEHFVTLAAKTNDRSRKLAQDIVTEVEATLDNATLTLTDHNLVSLRLVFWNVQRDRSSGTYGATMRFRAATEPQ
jgi:hypothetical protein